MDINASKVHAVVGSSWRMRQQVLDDISDQWRVDAPEREIVLHRNVASLEQVVMELDSPTLFGEPAMHQFRLVKGECRKAAQELLKPLVGVPLVAGVVVIIIDALPKNEMLGRALNRAKVFYDANGPQQKAFKPWLRQHLSSLDHPVAAPDHIAQTLIDVRGYDVDGVLSALETAALYAGDGPIDVSAVLAVTGGEADQPFWHFTNAVLDGRRSEAIRLLHAGQGLDPHLAINALANELRRCLVAGSVSDDQLAQQMVGGGRWSHIMPANALNRWVSSVFIAC